MKAMILAAGEGRRLRPLTETVPKPLLSVGGRPLIARLIELLRQHGVQDIAINLCHRPEAIRSFLGDGSRLGVQITYSLEAQPLGTAGGVKRMAPFFGDEPFLVLYGDVLTNMDLMSLRSFHTERRAALTMGLYQPEEPSTCGMVQLGADNRILTFVEKPEPGREPSGWANAGVYVVEPAVLRHIPPRAFDFGAGLFPLLLERGFALFGYMSDALVVDIGTPRGYARAQELASCQPVA
jgi:NDP-sugar pyrophosphorylase family protein